MPERLDRITVRTQNGDVTISWESRRVLLSLLAQEENTTEIRSSFEDVGASRPVELSAGQRTMLRDLFVDWMRDDVLFPEGWDDELFPEGTQRELTDLFLAPEKGDPSPRQNRSPQVTTRTRAAPSSRNPPPSYVANTRKGAALRATRYTSAQAGDAYASSPKYLTGRLR